MKRMTETHRMNWNGHLLEIIYEPNWLPSPSSDKHLASPASAQHIPDQRTTSPLHQTVFTHTRSQLSIITAAGGPVNYVDVMLEAETQSAAA